MYSLYFDVVNFAVMNTCTKVKKYVTLILLLGVVTNCAPRYYIQYKGSGFHINDIMTLRASYYLVKAVDFVHNERFCK